MNGAASMPDDNGKLFPQSRRVVNIANRNLIAVGLPAFKLATCFDIEVFSPWIGVRKLVNSMLRRSEALNARLPEATSAPRAEGPPLDEAGDP